MEGSVTISLKEYNDLQKFKEAVRSRRVLCESYGYNRYGGSSTEYYVEEKDEIIPVLFAELDKKAKKIAELEKELSKKKGWFK